MNDLEIPHGDVPEAQQGMMQLLLFLEENKLIDDVGLDLSGVTDLTPTGWRDLGQFFGKLGRRVNWYIGDWLNWGEDNLVVRDDEGVIVSSGEDAAAALGVESTTRDRYDEAQQITGLDHGTLLNISSLCRKVARSRRRKELGFWIHAEVAPLEPEEQIEWLARTIEEGWNRSSLRDAIREAKNPTTPDDGGGGGDDEGSGGVSHSERLEEAARLVWRQCQPTSDGSFLVPAEAMSQLATALGEQ